MEDIVIVKVGLKRGDKLMDVIRILFTYNSK